jgi:hypothetical protein
MGQHPIFATDTQAILEKIGFFLDEEHEDIYRFLRTRNLAGDELSRRISEDLDVARVIRRASEKWDGGYTLVRADRQRRRLCRARSGGHPSGVLFPKRRGDRLRLGARAA